MERTAAVAKRKIDQNDIGGGRRVAPAHAHNRKIYHVDDEAVLRKSVSIAQNGHHVNTPRKWDFPAIAVAVND
ncbi:hypothetical protein IP88_00275 [alpha proteobacterium AAP81b]|nr:hypothetical protein IP88_00275 [alpha proteobacterium AAP81b]